MIREFTTYLTSIRGYAVNTAIAYEKDLKQFVEFLSRNDAHKRWSTVTREDVDKYIISLSQSGHKPATLCRHISSISALYRYMQRQGLEVENPARYESRPKVGKHLVNTIPVNELHIAMMKAKGMVKMMLQIIAETGIRVQELLDIKPEDIDLMNGTIKINGKGNKERLVYVSQDTLKWLREQNRQHGTTVFGNISQREVRTEIWLALKDYCNAPQLSPHAIRHTYATVMAQKGMTATTLQKALGHEQLETTQRYIDYGQVQHERECRQLSIFN